MPEYESMFGEYRTKYLPQMMFNSYFMMRRIAYSAILVFGDKYPIMQAFAFSIICAPVLAYQIVMHPYLSNVVNAMMIINESLLIVLGAFLFIFAEPNNNSNRQEILGWAGIGVIVLTIAINIVVIWILKIGLIVEEIREWWRAYKAPKVRKTQNTEGHVLNSENFNRNNLNSDNQYLSTNTFSTNQNVESNHSQNRVQNSNLLGVADIIDGRINRSNMLQNSNERELRRSVNL